MKYSIYVTDEEAYDTWNVCMEEISPILIPRVVIYRCADKDEKKDGGKGKKQKSEGTSDDERQLLENIYKNLNLPITKRASILGLSPYMMNKLKKSLIEKGLVEQFSINLGKDFGGNITLLVLTDDGHKAINRRPKNKKSSKKESLEHHWWKGNIHQSYRKKSIPSEIEKSIGGKHADVGIVWQNQNIAIEVELTPKNALQNIIQDLECGFDKIFSCAKNKAVQNAIIKQFQSHCDYGRLNNKVSFRQLSDFEFVREISKL